jgi:hypothetical protein
VEAARIVMENILPHFEVVSVSKTDYLEALNRMALRAAAKHPVARIYTFNLSDFQLATRAAT